MFKHGMEIIFRYGYQFLLAAILTACLITDASATTWGKLIEFGTGVSVDSMRRTGDGGLILSITQNHCKT